MTPEEAKKAENEPVVGTSKDYQDLAKQYSQGHGHINPQVCPQCGYCPCCGRPRGNFNYPQYPTYPYLNPYPYYYQTGPTC
jgi:hypothetical protein